MEEPIHAARHFDNLAKLPIRFSTYVGFRRHYDFCFHESLSWAEHTTSIAEEKAGGL